MSYYGTSSMRQNAPGARRSRGQLTLCWASDTGLPGCSVHWPGQHAPCAASQARAAHPASLSTGSRS